MPLFHLMDFFVFSAVLGSTFKWLVDLENRVISILETDMLPGMNSSLLLIYSKHLMNYL